MAHKFIEKLKITEQIMSVLFFLAMDVIIMHENYVYKR
jgi:hypothetical protein